MGGDTLSDLFGEEESGGGSGSGSGSGSDSGSGGTQTGSKSQWFKMSKYTMKFTLKGGDALLDVQNAYDEKWTVSCDQDWVTYSPKKGIDEIFTVVGIRVKPGSEGEATLTFRETNGNYEKVKIIRSNNTKPEEDEGTGYVTNGHLPREFSVGPNKRVYFSAGNLEYRPSQDFWRFAQHQNYTVGSDIYTGSVFIAGIKSDNNMASTSYDGYIDKFAWGTGDQPCKDVRDVNQYMKFNDWGDHRISFQGEYTPGPWRTMSLTEWQYLMMSRKDAPKKLGVAWLMNGMHDISEEDHWCSINVLVLLPDNWTQPTGVSFVSLDEAGWFVNGYRYIVYGGHSDAKSDNKWTEAQWRKMEAAGAVLLPAGRYWTCSADSTVTYCYTMCYNTANGWVDPAEEAERYTKQYVRLVQDVK